MTSITASIPPPPTLEDRLWKVEHELMQVARRQYALEAFVSELDRVTKLKPFRIWNDILWMVVLDSRDMLVIHLASWTKGLCGRGGLLNQLKAHHLTELPAMRQPTERTERDAHLRKLLEEGYRAAFQRLFPQGTGVHASGTDLDGLKARLGSATKPLLNDRNRNRAHAFEEITSGSATMLGFPELRNALTMAEQLLNDLRLVGCSSTMSHHDMNDADCAATAEEFVDSILIGHSHRREVVMDGRDRQAFYDALHERHGGLPAGRQVMFNDNYE